MTESKPRHTPGPWDNRSRAMVVRHTATGEFIAEVGGRTTAEARENACLIARAPELLAENERLRTQLAELRGAASEAADYMGEWGHPEDTLAKLRAALARTEGEG